MKHVDGLTPSKYLYDTAKRNVDGEITIEEAKQLIDFYYETRQSRTYVEDDAEARTKDIALYIGLKESRTKDYLSELLKGV